MYAFRYFTYHTLVEYLNAKLKDANYRSAFSSCELTMRMIWDLTGFLDTEKRLSQQTVTCDEKDIQIFLVIFVIISWELNW